MITAPRRLTIVGFQELGNSARRGQCLSDPPSIGSPVYRIPRLSDPPSIGSPVYRIPRLSDQRHFDFQAWAKPEHQPRLGLIERGEPIQDEQHRRR